MFDDWEAEVSNAYSSLGHELGWAMFGTPAERIMTSSYGIVGYNPGHDWYCAPVWQQDDNLLFDEANTGQFFKHSRRMLAEMGWSANDFFYAQFVPFRSASQKTLKNSGASYKFSLDLWKRMAPYVAARVILTFSKDTTDAMAKVFCADRNGLKVGPFWIHDKAEERRIIRIPHPSRSWTFSSKSAVTNGAILKELISEVAE